MLPVAPGAKGQPPMPPILLSRGCAPARAAALQRLVGAPGGVVAVCSGGKRTAADAADTAVESLRARLRGGVGIREPRIARVMEMAPKPYPRQRLARLRQEMQDLRRHCGT